MYSQLRRSATSRRSSMVLAERRRDLGACAAGGDHAPRPAGRPGRLRPDGPDHLQADEHAAKPAKAPKTGIALAPRRPATATTVPGTTTVPPYAAEPRRRCRRCTRYRRSRRTGRDRHGPRLHDHAHIAAAGDASGGAAVWPRRAAGPRRRRSRACRRRDRARGPHALDTGGARPRPRRSISSRSSTKCSRAHRAVTVHTAGRPQRAGESHRAAKAPTHPAPAAARSRQTPSATAPDRRGRAPASRRQAAPGGDHSAGRKAGAGTRATGRRRPVRESARRRPSHPRADRPGRRLRGVRAVASARRRQDHVCRNHRHRLAGGVHRVPAHRRTATPAVMSTTPRESTRRRGCTSASPSTPDSRSPRSSPATRAGSRSAGARASALSRTRCSMASGRAAMTPNSVPSPAGKDFSALIAELGGPPGKIEG